MVKPWGADHCCMWRVSVQQGETRRQGALNTRLRISSGAVADAVLFLGTMLLLLGAGGCGLLGLQFLEVFAEAIQPLFPVAAVLLHPIRDLLQRRRLQTAGAPLGVAAAGDE